MPEIKPDYEWPRLHGDNVKKPGPWTSAKDFCTYKTSYEFAFPKTTPPPFYVEPTEPPKCDIPKELERDVMLTNYSTTYGRFYDWKYQVLDPLNQNYMPAFRKFNFLNEFDEKCRTKMPKQMTRFSEYKHKYQQHTEPNLSGVIQDQKKQLYCSIKGLTRDDVAKIDASEFGYGKYLDIYLSTNHLDYVHHKPKVIDKFKTSEVFVKPGFPPKPKEVELIDKGAQSLFKTFKYENSLQKSCSETRSCFQDPKPMVEPIIDCLMPTIRPTIGEIMATPGMYHTEYNHLGHNWSVQALIP
ncbi:uncharacterized protein LOC106666947 [Cimex lectularius]|uniref:Uncharacterized protein n=1 Tax=Cimex lectularius TaxID=79782 RepID=A0A8I6RRA7_CIMLE|nr:uncharacterized protein LOC106666947 [Cimex lectularius]